MHGHTSNPPAKLGHIILARHSGGNQRAVVLFFGARNTDSPHALIGQQRHQIRAIPGNAVRSGIKRSMIRVAADHRCDFAAIRGDRCNHALAGNGAAPDQTPDHRLNSLLENLPAT